MKKKAERHTLETCEEKERVESNMTPRFRADSVLVSLMSRKDNEESRTFDVCCGVPMRRYSVFEGLIDSLFSQNQ